MTTPPVKYSIFREQHTETMTEKISLRISVTAPTKQEVESLFDYASNPKSTEGVNE